MSATVACHTFFDFASRLNDAATMATPFGAFDTFSFGRLTARFGFLPFFGVALSTRCATAPFPSDGIGIVAVFFAATPSGAP